MMRGVRMSLTGGTRATVAAGTVAMLGGAAITLHGVTRSHPACALGGVFLAMIALTLISLAFIHRWFTNTSEERRALAVAARAAEDERNRYVSLKAALENEHGRLGQAMAAERASLAADLAIGREALRSEFEERRASLIAETMEATVLMYRNGKFAPQKPAKGNLIPFPQQQPERERPRGHNVVGP